jgi:hypothetical protein
VEPLIPFAADLWSVARPLRFWGLETGARMSVVRLNDGGLLVHSPVPLDEKLKAEVDALGTVEAVVAPSRFHHLSVCAWKDAYPQAVFACCPGLEKKRADFAWDRVLGDRPEAEWERELDQVWFAARTMESEVVFFHRRSRTMICADIIFNLTDHPKRLTRVVSRLTSNGKPGATWLERLTIRDRTGARAQIDRMLAWKPERILLAHGRCIERDGEAVLREAYAWL